MSEPSFKLIVVVLVAGVMVVDRNANVSAQVFNSPNAQQGGTIAPAGVQQAGGPAATATGGEVEQAGWAGIPFPKVTMPKLTMPKLTMPSMAAVTAPMKSGMSKVSSGTKKAWEGTKELFSLGQSSSNSAPAVRSSSQKKPSFWQRLLAKSPEPEGPQTVGEFMRQPRLDP